MQNILAAVFSALTEAKAQQPAGAKSWTAGVQVLDERDEDSGNLNCWVRFGEDSVLTGEYLTALKKHNLVGNKGVAVKKKFGRTSCEAVLVFQQKLKEMAMKTEREAVKVQALQQQVKDLTNQLKLSRESSASDEAMASMLESIRKAYQVKGALKPFKVSKFKPSKTSAARNVIGIPTLSLSDWHWGETVNASQIQYINEYNLEIAERRADVLFDRTMEVLFQRQAGVSYDGIVLQMAGDMLSGNIHDDLRATNAAPMLDCLMSLARRLSRAVLEFAENFEWVYVPCVVGNHGRMGKPGYKNVVSENCEMLLYRMVEQLVLCQMPAGRINVDFDISASPDLAYSLYNTGYLLTHGDNLSETVNEDNFWGALNRAAQKKNKRFVDTGGKGFKHMVCGHFHRYGAVGSVIVNGSLKGYDEYGFHHNYAVERPAQALWITHPTEGIISHHQIFVDEPDRDACDAPPVTRGEMLMTRSR